MDVLKGGGRVCYASPNHIHLQSFLGFLPPIIPGTQMQCHEVFLRMSEDQYLVEEKGFMQHYSFMIYREKKKKKCNAL